MITSVDESISVLGSEPVLTSGGVLPVTLARLTGEFLEFINILADIDPSDAEALAELEKVAQSLSRRHSGQDRRDRGIDPRVRGAGRDRSHGGGADRYPRADIEVASRLVTRLPLKNLGLLGLKRIETATTVVVIRKSPPSVTILDEAQIPDSFKRSSRPLTEHDCDSLCSITRWSPAHAWCMAGTS